MKRILFTCRDVTFIILTLTAYLVFGAPPTGERRSSPCKESIERLTVKGELITHCTGDHPNLTKYIQGMNDDAFMPNSVKRVLHEALVNRRTDIREATAEVRKAMGFRDGSLGRYAISVDEIVISGGKRSEISKNNFYVFGENQAMDTGNSSLNPKVWIDDIYTGETPEERLVHELAHIRFIVFLDRSFQDMAKRDRFPQWAVLKSKGRYALRSDFFHYLCERYAYEVQYHYVLSAAKSNVTQVSGIHPIFGDLRNSDETSVRKHIVAHLIENYAGAKEPAFRMIDEMPITVIFRGSYLRRPGQLNKAEMKGQREPDWFSDQLEKLLSW